MLPNKESIMEFFKYSETETDYLKSTCDKMATTIKKAGKLRRPVEPDIFKGLISSIVSQQISTKAAVTVFRRLEKLVGQITAKAILAKSDDEIKACGLSYRKVGYIKGICEAVINGKLDLAELKKMSDEQVISELIKLPGIGSWSAEMLLIFSLQRPDVLSYGDLIIRKGIMKLYGLDDLNKKDFQQYKERYSPYGTVASLYLWDLANE